MLGFRARWDQQKGVRLLVEQAHELMRLGRLLVCAWGPGLHEGQTGHGWRALQALADFHYEKLILDLTRNLTGDVVLGLHISGRNPSFYDGYPVEFNLSIEGRLDQALKEGLAGYKVPDMIQQQLEKISP